MKGPAIFLAQFAGPEAPFNSLDAITKWAAGHGAAPGRLGRMTYGRDAACVRDSDLTGAVQPAGARRGTGAACAGRRGARVRRRHGQ